VAEVGGPFGLHGPTYSHMLEAKDPHVWLEGEALFRVLTDAGATWARQDFWWGLVEPQRGEFHWHDFDRAVAAYNRHGVHLLAILCYASAWSGGTCPDTDEERERFGEYVYEMVRRYRGQVAAWEVWNEPNIQPFWTPRPDPELYAALLKVAYREAKRADPDCVIVGGALAGPDTDFLRGLYAHGIKGHFDVLSYHNYGQNLDLQTEWPAFEKLRQVMRENGDGDVPVWHTENGFFTGPVGLSEPEQAARIVRFSIGLLAMGIERTFQLTLRDWTDDPRHHDLSVYRGLTRADYRTKASFAAYRTMCQRLNDKRLTATFRAAPGVAAFLFEQHSGEDAVLVLWREDGHQVAPVGVDLDTPLVLVQQMRGDWQIHRDNSGRYELAVGPEPVYVVNPGARIRNQKLVSWENPVGSSLPRQAGAELKVRVRKPTPSAGLVRFSYEMLAGPGRNPGGRGEAACTFEESTTAPVIVRIDTSRLDVGSHALHWKLWMEGHAQPLASGYRPLEILSPLRLSFGGLRRLDVTAPVLPASIEYNGAEPARGTVALSLNGKPSGRPVPVVLQPGHRADVNLPLDLAPFGGGASVPIGLSLEASGLNLTAECVRPLISCPRGPASAKIDGDLGEWIGLPPQITPRLMRWEYINQIESPAPADLTVQGWVAYDDRGLWIAVDVVDDALFFPQTRAIWNWDSLQVGLDMGSDAQADQPYDANDLEIELGYREGGVWCYLGACPAGWPQEDLSAKLVGAVRPDPQRHRVSYELLIPADLLVSVTTLEAGTVMGFSILVNDNDGPGRAGWQELTPGIGIGKEPSRFAWLWLR
jgi:hypothetical protein